MNHIKLYDRSNGKVIEYLSDRIFGAANEYELLKDERTQLDFNAIAQGYTVDVISDFFVEKKVTNFLVEVGGEVRVLGENAKGEKWTVGIDKPVNEGAGGRPLQAILSLDNKSIATSGNYRKFQIKNGIKYSHTISSKTGYPVQHKILSATVVADDCMTADAFATAFMVMGHKKAIRFLESNQDMIQGYLVYSGDEGTLKTYYTPELEGKIKEKKN
jgi:thiamine biosynthesis lipoprotein